MRVCPHRAVQLSVVLLGTYDSYPHFTLVAADQKHRAFSFVLQKNRSQRTMCRKERVCIQENHNNTVLPLFLGQKTKCRGVLAFSKILLCKGRLCEAHAPMPGHGMGFIGRLRVIFPMWRFELWMWTQELKT